MGALVWTIATEGAGEVAASLRELCGADDPLAAELDEVPNIVLEELDQATLEAHATSAYASRTGELDASIGTDNVQVTADSVSADWGARAEHASYVEAKGFSRFGEVADAAVERIDERLSKIGR